MTEPALKVEHLTKDFGHGRGIFDVNFEIKPGEVFGFLGPNGAGKTTTIRHIMGFTKPGQGSASVLGMDCTTQYSEIMKHVGYLPGEIALPEGVSGWEFIRSMQKMRGVKDDRYLNSLLEMFDLDPQGNTKRMSLGTKRKLAVVTAFLADPEILILDEPTSGLDPAMQDKFIQFMVSEKRRNKTILLSSHIFPEVEATCDRIAIIKDGKIVSQVDANKLQHKEQKTFELFFANRKDLESASLGIGGRMGDHSLTVQVDSQDLSTFFNFQLRDRNVIRLVEHKFNLEKYFLDFYRTDKVFKTL
ncbi:Polyketide transporter ATPase component [Paucilactobacillus vaccinostercus DSM 20634]|uniref:Polyketide transporter ATPase component n=1 Tax=Paucilactobacillus vaccinostercus DSM 20634 TaxID=1423813 RepID=A0A0R2A4J5_9LACO|nr:ABC transporter ATP-binding protein [Paucilactobacillus vaccinostercus]KRM61943.1 Polyketide transporter ATPase component [Paucilactobacillus vaccinostercus DSM 20634]